jgi:nucleotide-binding universal stress UspA family protein
VSLRTILVPTDFSDVSRAALRCASGLAEVFGASLTVVHVVEDVVSRVLTAGVGDPRAEQAQVKADRDARDRLESMLAAAGLNNVQVHHVLLAGDPVSSILGFAEERAFDLIVIGTHGRRAAARFLLGSVAESVVRMAPCPVLTVRTCQRELVMR